MAYVALDTDVASNLIKGRLPGKVMAQLAPYSPCITFVTLGEADRMDHHPQLGPP